MAALGIVCTVLLLATTIGLAQDDFSAGRFIRHQAATPTAPIQLYLRDGVTTQVQMPENITVMFLCKFPDLKDSQQLTWSRSDGRDLGDYQQTKYTGPFLLLPNVTRRDTGTYICRTTDGRSRDLNLNFFYKPTVTVEAATVYGELGRSVVLGCEADGSPAVRAVEWTGPAAAPELGEAEFFSAQQYWGTVVTSRLRLAPVDPGHYGRYACRAANSYGHAEALVTLAPPSSTDPSPPAELAEYVKEQDKKDKQGSKGSGGNVATTSSLLIPGLLLLLLSVSPTALF